MLHLTLFSGTEGEMPPSGFTAVTFFGGTELRRPTLAREILHYRATRDLPKTRWSWLFGTDENFVLTVFGGTVITEPTLVEEHTALAAILRTGQIRTDELPAIVDGIELRTGGRASYRTFTLFGGCSTRIGNSKRERKALDAAIANGGIDVPTRTWLERLVEAPRSVRWRAFSQMRLAPA